jgi:prepilin-type N-terminal cleavage/methylation domain-containing protein
MKTTLHFTKTKAAGFTLIEVVVVAALIGVVATIAATAVIRARDKAATTTCISNLEQLVRAKSIWAFENKASGTMAVALSDLCGSENYLKATPTCPMNGSYTVGLISEEPTCTVTDHVIPQ